MDALIEKTLQRLESFPGREKLYWNVPRTTAHFLNFLVKSVKAQKVLEIGTSNGYSGIFFAEALRENHGMLFTIESHKKRFGEARQNFEDAGVAQYVKQIFGHAPEVFEQIFAKNYQDIPALFDLIFIDATKMEYASYFDVLFDHLASGGIFIADNASSHQAEMSHYLEKVRHHPQLMSVLLPFDNGLMLSYKK